MSAPDFWTSDAEAMELTMAGTRLIVREISEYLADLWRSVRRTLAGYARWTVTAGKGGNDTVA